MPFLAALAPVFVALGASAATATALSIGLITSLIEIGANLAIGAISKLFKHAPGVAGNSGSQLSIREPISYRRIIYGSTRVGGIITDMALTGANNEYLHLIITLAGHEVYRIGRAYPPPDSNKIIFLDGVAVTLQLEGTTWHPVPGNKYRGHMLVEFDLGDASSSAQPFPSFHTDAPTHWTSNHLQRGCAKVHVRLVWDATLFPGGLPQAISFDVQGKKVFDPRTSTTDFSRNPALCIRDFLIDTQYGLGVDAATIDDDSVIAAANICDEMVTLKAGGSHLRYTCDGPFDASIPRGSAVASMLTSMSGFLNAPGDKWRIFAGAYTDPVMTLTDSDLRGPIKWDARVSRRDLANAITGTFTGDENHWQPTDFPPYESATYLTEDGGDYIPQDIALDFTTDHIRCQRLAKIYLEKVRRQNQLVLSCSLAAFPLEPGDVFEFTHDRFGWTNKTFFITNTSLEVSGSQDAPTLGVSLTCVAIDTDVYAWDETTDEGDFTAPATTALPDIGTVAAPTGLALSNVEVTRADGVRALQIKATWDKPADTHVLNGGKINVWIRDKIRSLSVLTTSVPWNFVAGAQNTSFQYRRDDDGTPPVVINVLPGDVVTLAWVSGLGTWSSTSGTTDAAGNVGGLSGVIGVFPSTLASSGGGAGVLALIASFVDELGNLISSTDIHNVGDGPASITAPAGATQLFLGVNDVTFDDNGGTFVISVVGGQDGWRLAGIADGSDTSFYIPGVVDGSLYDVKITAQNSYGAISAGDEVDNFTATGTSATFTGDITSISQIQDVAVSAPASGDLLTWNGSAFVNQPPAVDVDSGGGGSGYPDPTKSFFGRTNVDLIGNGVQSGEPQVVYDTANAQWLMFYFKNTAGVLSTWKATAPSLEGPWTGLTQLTTLNTYHKFRVLRDVNGVPVTIGGNYYGYGVFYNNGTGSTSKEIYLFSNNALATDNWTLLNSSAPIIAKAGSGGAGVYDDFCTDQPDPVYDAGSGNVYVWYAAFPGTSQSDFGYSPRVRVAVASSVTGTYVKQAGYVLGPSVAAGWDHGYVEGTQLMQQADGTFFIAYIGADTRPGSAGDEPNTALWGFATAATLTGAWTKVPGPFIQLTSLPAWPTGVPNSGSVGTIVDSTNIWRPHCVLDPLTNKWYVFYNTGSGSSPVEKITFARQGILTFQNGAFVGGGSVPSSNTGYILILTTSEQQIPGSKVFLRPGRYKVRFQVQQGDVSGGSGGSLRQTAALFIRPNGTKAGPWSQSFFGSYAFEQDDFTVEDIVCIAEPAGALDTSQYVDASLQVTSGTPSADTFARNLRVTIEQL